MTSDAVIGCEAVDAGAEVVRLTTAAGAMRAIRWRAIRIAGIGPGPESEVKVQGVTEKVAPFLASHDPLWIAYGKDDFAEVMIEKDSPSRAAILAAFKQHLGERWRGDELTASELSGQMMIPPKVRIPKAVVVALVVVAIAFFLSAAILFFMQGARPIGR